MSLLLWIVYVSERKAVCACEWERERDLTTYMKEWETDGVRQVLERHCVPYALRIWPCFDSQLYFFKEPSISFHSAGIHFHPCEPQWAYTAKCFHQQQQSFVWEQGHKYFVGAPRASITQVAGRYNKYIQDLWTINMVSWIYFYRHWQTHRAQSLVSVKHFKIVLKKKVYISLRKNF